MKKIIRNIVIGILSLIVVVVLVLYGMFSKDIASINSIQKIDDFGLYLMDYHGDYGLDELLEQGGASSDGALVNFVVKKILKGLPVEFNIPDFGCSTFQAQTNEGDYIFGRNYDLDYVPSMIVRTNGDNGYASISVSNISVLGYDENKQPTNFMNSILTLAAPYVVMDGLNEMGVSIAVLLIKDTPTNQESDKIDLTTTAMIRLILDKAASVDEAIALFENTDMHASAGASYHFQVADANGNSAVIEYIGDKLNVIRKANGEHQALTNFLISEEKYGFGGGQDRYEIVMNALNENDGVLSEKEAMDVLKSVAQDKINEDGGRTFTQWSVVYNNSQKTMSICAGGNFADVYTFTLE